MDHLKPPTICPGCGQAVYDDEPEADPAAWEEADRIWGRIGIAPEPVIVEAAA